MNIADELNEEQRLEFAQAMSTIMEIVHNYMDGSLVGSAGLIGIHSDGTSEELAVFHFDIHDASMCDHEDEHANHPGTGTVQ